MAIKFKKIKTSESILTEDELKIVSSTEDYIDSQIREQKSEVIVIPLSIAKFHFCPTRNSKIVLSTDRRILMSNELERRYRKAGWEATVHVNDELDIRNIEGDVWVLTGIK
jgi:hypothetical protein